MKSLRKKVDRASGKWADEIPNVLLRYKITHRISTGETPFWLAFGLKAVLRIELELLNFRSYKLNMIVNQIALQANLDVMKETFDLVRRRVETYQ